MDLSEKIRQVKIKNVTLPSNVILAPMAGLSDLAFRDMCAFYGAGLVCTEMVSAKALSYSNKKTEELLFDQGITHPVAVQIFGHEPEVMAQAVKNPLLDKFDIIDINMGCPAPKIIRNGDGSALLNNFNLARKIIGACVAATDKPITVKFRIGFDLGENIAVEFAKMCESAGASAITIHGRTTKQGYSGQANLNAIAEAKKSVKIPVFVSGDCRSRADFERIMNITGADGVMIGRGALGSPEIFKEILLGQEVNASKFAQLEYHYETLKKWYGERAAVLSMRTHLASFLKGRKKSAELTKELLKMDNYEEILRRLREIFG